MHRGLPLLVLLIVFGGLSVPPGDLRAEEAPSLDALATSAARGEIAREVATARRAAWEVEEVRALLTSADEEDLAFWARHHGERHAQVVASVAPILAEASERLVGNGAVVRATRAWLARPETADVVAREFVMPRLRPTRVSRLVGSMFVEEIPGRLSVPAVPGHRLNDTSRTYLLRLVEVRRMAARVHARLRGMAAELDADEDPALAAALRDPLLAILALRAPLAKRRDGPADPLVEAACAAVAGVFEEENGRRRVREAARATVRSVLAQLRVAEVELDVLRLEAEAAAARLESGALERRWRDVLTSNDVDLLLLQPPPRETNPRTVLREQTPFGRALARGADGRWTLRRHAVHEWDDHLARLEEKERRRSALVECFPSEDRFSSPGSRDAVIRFARAAAALRQVGFDDPAPDPERVRKHEATIRAEIERSGGRESIDLSAPTWDAAGLSLLRSSAFYNPRTPVGGWLYDAWFPDHHTARVFGFFGWNAKVSKDADDFVERIRARKRQLTRLARTHRKLILILGFMPPWLGDSDDDGTFENGGRSNREAHPPKDPAVWARMVRETALVFREAAPDVERYYEFWNEPDLEYWQGTLEEFLDLYALTARTVREADPEGKVGGTPVNQWDHGLRKAPGSLNLALLQAAKERDLPLDFISWHHFGRPPAAIAEAKACFEGEALRLGFEDPLEYLITEWSVPARGTTHAPAGMAEMMLALQAAGLDAQTIACWEEFHAMPEGHFAPWGMLTQQGVRHNTWWVHFLIDRLARESRGIAVLRPSATRTVVISKERDGTFELLLWERSGPAALAAAWKVLEAAGFESRIGRAAFQTGRHWEAAIREGRAPAPRWDEAFEKAAAAYAAVAARRLRATLSFSGASEVEVLSAEGVSMRREPKPVDAHGAALTLPLEQGEVVRLRIRVR